MAVSRNNAYIYIAEFCVFGKVCLAQPAEIIVCSETIFCRGNTGYPDGNGAELTYRISRPEPVINRSGDYLRR